MNTFNHFSLFPGGDAHTNGPLSQLIGKGNLAGGGLQLARICNQLQRALDREWTAFLASASASPSSSSSSSSSNSQDYERIGRYFIKGFGKSCDFLIIPFEN